MGFKNNKNTNGQANGQDQPQDQQSQQWEQSQTPQARDEEVDKIRAKIIEMGYKVEDN